MVLVHLYFNFILCSFFIKKNAQKMATQGLCQIKKPKNIGLIHPRAAFAFSWVDNLLTLNNLQGSFYSCLITSA